MDRGREIREKGGIKGMMDRKMEGVLLCPCSLAPLFILEFLPTACTLWIFIANLSSGVDEKRSRIELGLAE